MLRIVQTGHSLPFFWPVDSTAEFQAGQIAQLSAQGNQIVCGVSDGRSPIGIIDDVKTNAFSDVSIDEIIILAIPTSNTTTVNGKLVLLDDIKVELENPHITASSFISNPVPVELNPKNGVITFLAGTELNFSQTGAGVPDAIRTVVNYTYAVPNTPGDDSVSASGRVTVWFQRIIAQTDQYDTTARYAVNDVLFCNEKGQLTTKRISEDYPGIAIVTAPPTSAFSALEFMLL